MIGGIDSKYFNSSFYDPPINKHGVGFQVFGKLKVRLIALIQRGGFNDILVLVRKKNL